jgi:hypothetical protein
VPCIASPSSGGRLNRGLCSINALLRKRVGGIPVCRPIDNRVITGTFPCPLGVSGDREQKLQSTSGGGAHLRNRRETAGVPLLNERSSRHIDRERHGGDGGDSAPHRPCLGRHGRAGQRRPAWCGRKLCDAIIRKLSWRFHQSPQPRRWPSGADRRWWHPERRVERDRHRGLPEVPAPRQERTPCDGGAVHENPARRRSRVRPSAPRRDLPSPHASGREVHGVSSGRSFREQRRRASRHVLVGQCVGPVTSVRTSSCLGGR